MEIGNPPLSSVLIAQSARTGMTRTGSTSEAAIETVTIPGGLVGANGRVDIRATYNRTTGAAKIGARVRFGAAGTAGDSLVALEHDTDSTLVFAFSICAKNSQAAQITSANSPNGATQGSAPVQTTADMTVDQPLVFTGRTEGNAADVLTLTSYQVVVYPKA